MSSPLTPHEIELVQKSFAKVAAISDAAAQLFYGRLFEVAPEVRPLFKDDLDGQGKKLMRTLALAVAGLSKMEKLLPMLRHLGRRHLQYGCEDEHYDVVGQTLIWTLEQGLGDDFTAPVKDAWLLTYNAVAGVMKQAASEAEREKSGPHELAADQEIYESPEFQEWLHAAAFGDLMVMP